MAPNLSAFVGKRLGCQVEDVRVRVYVAQSPIFINEPASTARPPSDAVPTYSAMNLNSKKTALGDTGFIGAWTRSHKRNLSANTVVWGGYASMAQSKMCQREEHPPHAAGRTSSCWQKLSSWLNFSLRVGARFLIQHLALGRGEVWWSHDVQQ